MNERINNLIDQTGFGSYAEIPDTYIVHKNDLIDFAKTIVQECCEVINAAKPGVVQVPAEVALDMTSKNIKARFEVRE
jgi:hypothetical protein